MVIRKTLTLTAALTILVGLAPLVWCQRTPVPGKMVAGDSPEQLVYVRTSDDIFDAGVVFSSPRKPGKSIAVIWIHGWGANFYEHTYVAIGRALADLGYTTVVGNTRMHDLGNALTWRSGKRVRGGGYWGIASEQVRDVAAWVDFAHDQGFKKVILVGHSAGWEAVARYEAEKQDDRVAGLVIASGLIDAATPPSDPDQIAQAKRMTADGRPEDLVRDPKRSFPSFISAATMLDMVNSPPESRDFWGTKPETLNPSVTRIHCPLLAFFGSHDDVGSEKTLELLKSSIRRQSSGPSRVDTTIIKGADHMYENEELQVAQTIAKWIDNSSR